MTTHFRHTECSALVGALDDFLEGGLIPEVRKSLETHLKTCARCGEIVRQMRESMDLCRRAKTPCVDRKCLEKAVAGARKELVRRGLIPR